MNQVAASRDFSDIALTAIGEPEQPAECPAQTKDMLIRCRRLIEQLTEEKEAAEKSALHLRGKYEAVKGHAGQLERENTALKAEVSELKERAKRANPPRPQMKRFSSAKRLIERSDRDTSEMESSPSPARPRRLIPSSSLKSLDTGSFVVKKGH